MNPSWSSLKPDRVIGIDPGLSATGIGIVERDADGQYQTLHIDTIKPPGTASTAQKLHFICKSIRRLIEIHKPDCLAVEETFYHKNVKSALALGQARGAALLAAAEASLDVMELSPKTVKQAAVGTGGAAKHQVGVMITAILQLPEIPKSPDACDALAVALAALNRRALPAEVRT
jgi:crossover junction endodeoxyribonuclease RuvC